MALSIAALGAAVLFLGLAVIVTSGRGDSTEDSGWAGTPLGTPLDRPGFTLTDTAGRPYDFATETQGKLTLLFFGYTNCPDVCPIQMRTLDAVLDTPGAPEATVVFVTTDPQRDTPERLRDWLDDMSRDFVGLTGTREEIAAAEEAAEVAGSIVPTEVEAGAEGAEGDYEVNHAAHVIAYTPDDRAHVVYPFGVRQEDWAADLPRLLERWGAPPEGTGS